MTLPPELLDDIAEHLRPPEQARCNYADLLAFSLVSKGHIAPARRAMLKVVCLRTPERMESFCLGVDRDDAACVEQLILVIRRSHLSVAREHLMMLFSQCRNVHTLRLIVGGPFVMPAGARTVLKDRVLRELHIKDQRAIGRQWTGDHVPVVKSIGTLRLTDVRFARSAVVPAIPTAHIIALNGNAPDEGLATTTPLTRLTVLDTVHSGPAVGLPDTTSISLLRAHASTLQSLDYTGPRMGAVRDIFPQLVNLQRLTLLRVSHHGEPVDWQHCLLQLPPRLAEITIRETEGPSNGRIRRLMKSAALPSTLRVIRLIDCDELDDQAYQSARAACTDRGIDFVRSPSRGQDSDGIEDGE